MRWGRSRLLRSRAAAHLRDRHRGAEMPMTPRGPPRCRLQRGAIPNARKHRGRPPAKPRIPSPSGRYTPSLLLWRNRIRPGVAVAAGVLHAIFETRKRCAALKKYLPVRGRSTPAPAIRLRLLERPNIVLGELLSHSSACAITAPGSRGQMRVRARAVLGRFDDETRAVARSPVAKRAPQSS